MNWERPPRKIVRMLRGICQHRLCVWQLNAMELDMTNLVEIFLVVSTAILVAIVIVGFFTMRRYIQKCMLNKYEDHD